MKVSIDQSRLAGLEYARGCVTVHEGKFLRELVNLSEATTVVEIGAWIGVSTLCLSQELKERKHGMLYSIDPHVGSVLHRNRKVPDTESLLRENLKRFEVEEYVTVIKMTSLEALERWPVELGLSIDMLFIDGEHHFKSVRSDFFGWSPWVKEKGIVAFHDYPVLSGPRRTIDEIVKPSGLYEELGHIQRLVAFRRR